MRVSTSLSRALSHYRRQQKIALAAVRAARRAVSKAKTSESAVTAATMAVATYQLASATRSSTSVAAEMGRTPLTAAAAFAGTTQLGYPIETPIETIISRMKADSEAEIAAMADKMFAGLDLFVKNEVIASGVDAASAEIAVDEEFTQYVRVLVPPSCDRCTVLAGKIYLDLDGFERHPRCDCEHWPVGTEEAARAAGLILDPMEAFEKGQIGGWRTLADGSRQWVPAFSKADEQAIRDGADITEIINAKRAGRRAPKGVTNAVTLEMFGRTVKATLNGTTKRATWRKQHPDLPIRLRPESIYAHAKDREDALRLLRLYGYLKNEADGTGGSSGGSGSGSSTPPAEDAAPTPASGGQGSGDGGDTPPAPPAPDEGDPFENIPGSWANWDIRHPDLDKLTQDEQDNIAWYASNGHSFINRAMRGQYPMDEGIRREIDSIRSGVRKYPLPEAVRVTRETDLAELGLTSYDELSGLVDTEYDQPAFLSTSFSRTPPPIKARRSPVWLELIIPAGTPALAIVGSLVEKGQEKERELLVMDGRTLRIVRVRFNSRRNRWQLFVEVQEER